MSMDKLDELAEDMKKLRQEYEKYFMGLERLEPQKMRDSVKKTLRRLQGEHSNNTAYKFRLQTLQASMVTYEAHWNRITRQIEEGTFKRDKLRAQAILRGDSEAPAATSATSEAPAPAGKPTAAPREYPESLRKLHEAYEQARRQAGETKPLPIEALAATVQKQVAAIKAQYNCKSVEFKVTVKDGKPVLKAIPKT
jgi:hypothetical protein